LLSARNAILAVVVLMFVSIGATVYNLTRPPDGDGLGENSYGTRAHGHRALVDSLKRLGRPTDRSMIPPPSGVTQDHLLAMIAPDPGMLRREPEHLRRTADWVERGGHLLMALPPEMERYYLEEDDESSAVLAAIGLPDLYFETIDVDVLATTSADLKAEADRKNRETAWYFRLNEERPTGTTTVTLAGSLNYLQRDISEIRLPKTELQAFSDLSSFTAATATGSVYATDGTSFVIAAIYPKGHGTIIVVSDAELFNNYLVGSSDNAVLAISLLGAHGTATIFDGFYHGLFARGNPFWLLTRPHYGLLFAMVVIAIAVWIWRQGIMLGPPLPTTGATRRSLSEYLDAMAALFTRADQKRYVLESFRNGVLWILRERLLLRPDQNTVECIASALERREPERARQLQNAVDKIDQILQQKTRIDDEQFLQAAREINQCL